LVYSGLYPPWLSCMAMLPIYYPPSDEHISPPTQKSSLIFISSYFEIERANMWLLVQYNSLYTFIDTPGARDGAGVGYFYHIYADIMHYSHDGWCQNTHFSHQSWEVNYEPPMPPSYFSSYHYDGLWAIRWTGNSLHWVWWTWRPPSPPSLSCIPCSDIS
jgi:hypothetical protein